MVLKSKNEILTALARQDADRILLAGLLDKQQMCEQREYLTHTRFLDLSERALCTQAIRLAGGADHAVFWGGYEQAERGIYLFYPSYLDEQSARQSAPLALLRAHKRPGDTLTHRDYLGALMGLQIDRSVVGDILVHEEGADLFVLEDIADFILLHFSHAGRKQISLTREPIEKVRCPQITEKEGTGSVASPRLDSVAALIFGLSRRLAQEKIEKGLVFVNDLPCLKAERTIEAGDRLTVRGMGRARICEFTGKSKKGRLWVRFVKSA